MSKFIFYAKLIYIVLGIHLTVYAVALARHEFAVFSLDTKISNLITLSEGKNYKTVLERIPLLLQTKIPVEPKIYNIFSSIKSLFPQCDNEFNLDSYKELSYLLSMYKSDLKNINLNGFIFLGSIGDSKAANFTHSSFNDVKLQRAVLSFNQFAYSRFYKVDFGLAEMIKADFTFAAFDNCKLDSVNLQNSNLCGASFINTLVNTVNLRNSNLIGVDLSYAILLVAGYTDRNLLEDLQGAYYNSKAIINNSREYHFLKSNFSSCIGRLDQIFPPTKFPPGFDPEAHGMIDISKW